MDKLQMAHEMALAMAADGNVPNENIIAISWQYADAMMAEHEKRNNSKPVITEQDKQRAEQAYANIVKPPIKEWQPDWSQAPDDKVQYFAVDESGQGGWYVTKPELCFDHWYWSDWGERLDGYDHAPSFGYTGNWQDSLRKRPTNI